MKIVSPLASAAHVNVDVEIATLNPSNKDIKPAYVQRLNTKQLFAHTKEVMIEHLNETYILRITKQNKLILTK